MVIKEEGAVTNPSPMAKTEQERPIEFERTVPGYFKDGSDHTFTVHLRWSDWDRLDGAATAADIIAALQANPQLRASVLDGLDLVLGIEQAQDNIKSLRGQLEREADARVRAARELERVSAELAAERARVVELRDAINIDRTGLAAGLNHVKAVVKGYQWIADGEWGSYSYEEHTIETLRREVGYLIKGACDGAARALKASGERATKAVRLAQQSSATAEPQQQAEWVTLADLRAHVCRIADLAPEDAKEMSAGELCKALELEIDSEWEQRTAAESERDELRRKLEEAEAQVNDLTRCRQSAYDEHVSLSKAHAALYDKLEAAEAEQQHLREEYEKAERLWKAATVDRDAAKDDAKRGWDEVHGLMKELGGAQRKLQAAEAELAKVNACWHCKVSLLPQRPRCDACPDECDDEACSQEGCLDDQKRAATTEEQAAPAACWCRRCDRTPLLQRSMIVCPDCGNKRCPRSEWHDFRCTGSNEPGQVGVHKNSPAKPELPGGRPRRSAEVQRALDDCRQAIADVHAGPLTAEQHGRMRRKVAKLEAELAAAHACIEAADIVRDVCRDQSTLCDGRFEMALSHYDAARAEYERVTKGHHERGI